MTIKEFSSTSIYIIKTKSISKIYILWKYPVFIKKHFKASYIFNMRNYFLNFRKFKLYNIWNNLIHERFWKVRILFWARLLFYICGCMSVANNTDRSGRSSSCQAKREEQGTPTRDAQHGQIQQRRKIGKDHHWVKGRISKKQQRLILVPCSGRQYWTTCLISSTWHAARCCHLFDDNSPRSKSSFPQETDWAKLEEFTVRSVKSSTE